LLLAPAAANAQADVGDDAEEEEFVIDATILQDDHEQDCHEMDLIPLDAEVDDELDLFHDAETWDEDDTDTP
jgi:hypothetical protein